MRKQRTPIIRNAMYRAFTLIEVLIVITIIALLIGLLLPAISSVMTNMEIARVKSDIVGLETALADFKAKYGVYPPSSITLHNATNLGDGDAAANWNTDAASKAKFTRIWPDFDFATEIIINDSGTDKLLWANGTTLQGAECLVFFLGGVPKSFGSFDLNGFSSDVTNPFTIAGSSRSGPFFEFNVSRLESSSVVTSTPAPLIYKDVISGQTKPYVYASSYGGRGYVDSDITGYLSSGPYKQSSGGYWKPKSFQIISPGFDAKYGTGGDTTSLGADDEDNITNFSDGLLGN